MAAFGATLSFIGALTKVGSPLFADLHHSRHYDLTARTLASLLRASWIEARVTKVARVSAKFSKSLARRWLRPNQEKMRSTTPAARQDDEALHVVAPLDDLHAHHRHRCHRSVNLPSVVAAIGRSVRARGSAVVSCRAPTGTIAVLDRGGVDNHPHRQPFAVDQGVDFTALHLLSGVVTHLVVSAASFSADFTDWLSRTAADGLASRRGCRRRGSTCR